MTDLDDKIDEQTFEIKREVFGFEDDEMDIVVAYRDELDLVGNIRKFVDKKVAQAEKEARIDEVYEVLDVPLSYLRNYLTDRITTLASELDILEENTNDTE